MEKIVLATNNKHKLKEFREILSNYEVLSLNDIDFHEDIIEDGNSFVENAFIKTDSVSKFLKDKGLNYTIIADDSGLCVDSLDGKPGIYSARYAGDGHNDQANRDKLLKELSGKDRSAYFICVIAVLYPNGVKKSFEGRVDGYITEEEIGDKSFGYDCIFYSNELNKTFGEANDLEKNNVSHRGRAIEKMLKEF